MMVRDLQTPQGLNLSFDFFLGLSCQNIGDRIYNSTNVTKVYETLLKEVADVSAPLWSQGGEGCYGQMCQAIFGGGNPDIAGIGLVTAYCIEFFLAFILSVVLLIVWKRQGSPEITARKNPKTNALCQALAVFSDASIFFALAVTFATAVILTPTRQGDGASSRYDSTQAILASTVTVAPCLVAIFALQCCGQKIGMRLSILAVANLFNVALVILPEVIIAATSGGKGAPILPNQQLGAIAAAPAYMNLIGTNDSSLDLSQTSTNYDVFTSECLFINLDSNVVKLVLTILVYSGILIGLIGQLILLGLVILFALPLIKFRIEQLSWKLRKTNNRRGSLYRRQAMSDSLKRAMQKEGPRSHLPRKLEILAFIVIPLLLSFCSGGALLGVRLVPKNWSSDAERQWGFGQIVSLIIFVPVILEFPYRWAKERPSKYKHEHHGHGDSVGIPDPASSSEIFKMEELGAMESTITLNAGDGLPNCRFQEKQQSESTWSPIPVAPARNGFGGAGASAGAGVGAGGPTNSWNPQTPQHRQQRSELSYFHV